MVISAAPASRVLIPNNMPMAFMGFGHGILDKGLRGFLPHDYTALPGGPLLASLSCRPQACTTP